MRRHSRWLARVVLAATLSRDGLAQPGTQGVDADPFGPLLKPSHLWLNWPAGAMYEGDIHIPVALFSRTANLRSIGTNSRAEVDSSGYRATGKTFYLLPHFTFRQSKDNVVPSAPVLTPTFNPGVEFSQFWMTTQPRGNKTRWLFPSFAPTSRSGTLHAVQVRLAHYSNGQAGCLYADQVKDAKGDCPSRPPGGALNERDGSFSTHYVELGYTYNSLLFDQTLRERARINLGGSFRWNPHVGFGGMTSELADAYGWTSALARVEFRSRHDSSFVVFRQWPKWPMTLNVSVEAETAFNRYFTYPSERYVADAWVAFPRLYGFGFSARWMSGADYYNVGFGRKIGGNRGFSFGILFDHSQAIALTREAKTATGKIFK